TSRRAAIHLLRERRRSARIRCWRRARAARRPWRAREQAVPPDQLTLGPWTFLLVGLLLAFAGRVLVVLQLNLLGALLGALAASGVLAAALAGGLAPPPNIPVEALQVGALLVGAILGWVLAGLLRRVAL